MMKPVVFLLFLFVFVCVSLGKTCNSPSTYGEANLIASVEGNSNMVFVNSVPNGKLYHVTVGDAATGLLTYPVVHVWGNATEQGIAHGQLLSAQIINFIDEAWDYILGEVENSVSPMFPRPLRNMIATLGLETALDYEYDITVDYTPQDFYDEMKGVSLGSGVDYLKLRRVHQLPGLTKGHCSMFGTWGKMVPSDGHVIQMRALDWDMDGPWGDNPAIVVYHEKKVGIHANNSWVNVGFVGWIGGLTGMSDQQMGISEIGVTYPGDEATGGYPDEGPMPRKGYPFIVLLRDILKKDKTIHEAFHRMDTATRCENLILGVGDGKQEAGYFSGAQYSPAFLREMTPENQEPNEEWHPRIEDTVYYGMDWECPTYDSELAGLLQNNSGLITGPLTISNIMGQLQSGSNHIGIYDLTSQEMWVSFAGPTGTPDEKKNAWLRQYTHFDVVALFNEPQQQ